MKSLLSCVPKGDACAPWGNGYVSLRNVCIFLFLMKNHQKKTQFSKKRIYHNSFNFFVICQIHAY